MRATTLQKRLNKIYTGSKSAKAYQIVKDIVSGTNVSYCMPYGFGTEMPTKGILVRPCYTSGSGRYTTNQDHTAAVLSLLSQIGVKHEYGNDAQRGGATGQFIKILTAIKY